MEMMLFAAFAQHVERTADCNWDSAQDEAWKREVEKLHLISFCQVVRSWLWISQSLRLCPHFSLWRRNPNFGPAPAVHRNRKAGFGDAEGTSTAKELHVSALRGGTAKKSQRAIFGLRKAGHNQPARVKRKSVGKVGREILSYMEDKGKTKKGLKGRYRTQVWVRGWWGGSNAGPSLIVHHRHLERSEGPEYTRAVCQRMGLKQRPTAMNGLSSPPIQGKRQN